METTVGIGARRFFNWNILSGKNDERIFYESCIGRLSCLQLYKISDPGAVQRLFHKSLFKMAPCLVFHAAARVAAVCVRNKQNFVHLRIQSVAKLLKI